MNVLMFLGGIGLIIITLAFSCVLFGELLTYLLIRIEDRPSPSEKLELRKKRIELREREKFLKESRWDSF